MLNKSRVWSQQFVSFLFGLTTYQHPLVTDNNIKCSVLPYKSIIGFSQQCCRAPKYLVLLLTVVSIEPYSVCAYKYSCLSHLACKLTSFSSCYIFIFGLSASTTFPHSLINCTNFEIKVTKHKTRVLIFSANISETKF